ncbi:MAG TPA: cyclic nucleotide-binding domain-containing protein, partial [Thiotrichales bacterium]|nr:cyclic nucleotide-binding domain-containing protein [Thiotrichales bacterium]
IEAGSAEAKQALAHVLPRMFDAIAASDARVFKVNAEQLDLMLTWDQTGSFTVEELDAEEDDDWMSRLLQTEAFHRIPPANIQAIFTSLEDIHVKKGDVIIKQDDPGDYFYIIKTGRCRVFRKMPGQDKEIKLADLSMGDSFGEEALISDSTRNASIVMLTDGLLTRLSKQQFLELLNEPLLKKVDYTSASYKVKNGEAEWLDVRLPGEYTAAHIKGCSHIPLIFLRMKSGSLDKFKNYIVYCDTERRSSAAAYLLSERGFKTSVLINGIKDVPHDDLEGSNIE